MTAQTRHIEMTRWRKPVIVGLTGLILVAAVAIAAARYGAAVRADAVAIDYRFYLTLADRWHQTGTMYTPAQLAGPYVAQPMGWTTMDFLPSLYPPPAIFLFLPFQFLPAILWWAIPLGIIAIAIWRLQPADWAWPLMAAILLFPDISSSIIVGNTTMWIVAFLAAGLLYSWPAILILLKPALVPFAIVGTRHRSWWIALGNPTMLARAASL